MADGGPPLPVVLVGRPDDGPLVWRLRDVLGRVGHPVAAAEPTDVPRMSIPDDAVVVLLVTRALETDLSPLLAVLRGRRVLPVVLDDPTGFGWGRLDELLYLDLRGGGPELVDAAVVRALTRFASDGPVTALPEGEIVFISYAFEDDDVATRVERHLRGAGLTTFRATDLLFGADWLDLMDRAVGSAWAVVALISPAYLRSFWCYEEFGACARERRILVQVGSTAKLQRLQDEWWPTRLDLAGVPEPRFGERLLAVLADERSRTARQRVERAEREAPPRRTTSSMDVYKSWVPWDDDLLDRKLHPQLRGDPVAVQPTDSLQARRQAASDFMAARY